MENLEASLKRRIDDKGYFVCDEFTNEVSDTLIDVKVPEGFFKPLWNGSEWIEGDVKTAQIQAVKNARNSFNNAIQNHLDSKAQEMRYDNIMSARSWAGYENPYQVEALKLAKWAGDCWTVAGQIETDVSSGARDMPTIDEVLSELPKYE